MHRWGPHLLPTDLTWKVALGHPPFSATQVQAQMAARYNPSHDTVAYAFKRWSSAQRNTLQYRDVVLVSAGTTTAAHSALSRLVLPATSPASAQAGAVPHGFLSVTSVQKHVVEALRLRRCAGDSTEAGRVGVDIAAAPTVTSLSRSASSFEELVTTIWPATPDNDREVMTLVFDRLQSVQLGMYHWVVACAEGYKDANIALGCALGHNAANAAPFSHVDVASIALEFFTAETSPDRLPVLSAHNMPWVDLPGLVLYRATWNRILDCMIAVESSECAAAGQAAFAQSDADTLGDAMHSGIVELLSCCLSTDEFAGQGFVFPAALPF